MRMDRVGQLLRAIRRHQRLTQQVIANRIGISQSALSRAEHGNIGGMTLRSLDRIATALGAVVIVDVRYRGGLGDRLIDAAHARLVERVVKTLLESGWLVHLEFGFNVYGERGSVDILAWFALTQTLLIVEVKSRFTDLQAMLSSLSRKVRLVPPVVQEELGWAAVHVAHIVVADGTHANRSVVARHAATFDAALPARAMELRRWIRRPVGAIAGVWLTSTNGAR
jgi:transcriptional regulator with XRE-family HTH domain